MHDADVHGVDGSGDGDIHDSQAVAPARSSNSRPQSGNGTRATRVPPVALGESPRGNVRRESSSQHDVGRVCYPSTAWETARLDRASVVATTRGSNYPSPWPASKAGACSVGRHELLTARGCARGTAESRRCVMEPLPARGRVARVRGRAGAGTATARGRVAQRCDRAGAGTRSAARRCGEPLHLRAMVAMVRNGAARERDVHLPKRLVVG